MVSAGGGALNRTSAETNLERADSTTRPNLLRSSLSLSPDPSLTRLFSLSLILSGTVDEVVPFWHGQELFLALPPPWRARPFWVSGAGHNNIEVLLRDTNAFVDSIAEFLDLHVPARTGEPVGPPIDVRTCIELAVGGGGNFKDRDGRGDRLPPDGTAATMPPPPPPK